MTDIANPTAINYRDVINAKPRPAGNKATQIIKDDAAAPQALEPQALEPLATRLFDFKGNNVRVIVDERDPGNPWFVAQDACAVLGMDTSNLSKVLDDDERGSCPVQYTDQVRYMTTINESGLYSLILRSRKPEAKAFKKWVTSEVLPSIRKTGSYVGSPEINSSLILEIGKKMEQMEKAITAAKPLTSLAAKRTNGWKTWGVQDAAKIFGIPVKQVSFTMMRERLGVRYHVPEPRKSTTPASPGLYIPTEYGISKGYVTAKYEDGCRYNGYNITRTGMFRLGVALGKSRAEITELLGG